MSDEPTLLFDVLDALEDYQHSAIAPTWGLAKINSTISPGCAPHKMLLYA